MLTSQTKQDLILRLIGLLLALRKVEIQLLLNFNRSRRIKRYKHLVRVRTRLRRAIPKEKAFNKTLGRHNIVPSDSAELYQKTNMLRDLFEELCITIQDEVQQDRFDP